MNRLSLVFMLIIVCHFTPAKGDTPLLMANKNNLYQRILTLPGAILYSQAKETQKETEPLPVFSIYYVYSRMKIDNVQWLKVSLGRYGNRMRMGWIREDKTLEWSQRLTLSFREPVDNQDRVLLFKDKKSAEQLATSSNINEYEKIYQAAVKGEKLANSPVIAIQPSENIDIRKNFYLVPIHEYEDIFMKGTTARLLQVSSIPIPVENKFNKTPEKTQLQTSLSAQPNRANNVPYTAGITFVVDSTLSMQRFIDRTRQAVKTIFNDIKQANLLGNVSFGLIAYRDNIEITPNVEYVTKQYVSLKQGGDPDVFMKQVADLQATEWTTKNFIEDGFAGIYQAIQGMDWSPFSARYIVLITDASSRDGNDPLSSTGLKLAELKKLAHEKNIAIFVMHLLTPASKFNHNEAKKQYTALSEYPNIGSFYYGVPTGNTNELGNVIEKLSEQITTQVGQMTTGDNNTKVIIEAKKQEPTQLQDLKTKVDKLGYTLRMRYLQEQGEQAPDVFKAWIVDKDFKTPEKRTVDARVLLTRNQLSDLHSILKQILNTARKGVMSPKNFLNDLKSLAATTSRNPDRLGGATSMTAGKGNSLAEMGFMREYIEGLPYTGKVMNLSLDDWQRWPVKQQTEFLQNIREKINYYQFLHDNVDLWVSLKGGAIDGDSVFPVPLVLLP
ncbi:MAG: VWA domain-containing protein [Methylococcaceae bacterium]|nr:VWA domain-containing protein [Methylococcaceae bacterium]